MRKLCLGVAACGLLLVVAGTAPVAGIASESTLATVTGTGTAAFPPGTPVAGDTEEISVDARIAADGSVKGRFKVVHRFASGVVSGNVGGDVTCLTIVGNTAVLSGFITNGKLPGVPGVDPIGAKVALSIVDNGGAPDAVGVDSSFAPTPHPVPDCEPVPPFLTLGSGDFTVHAG
jgi:hypothetical protein